MSSSKDKGLAALYPIVLSISFVTLLLFIDLDTMKAENSKESPLAQLISFNKLLERYEVMAQSDDIFLAKKAKRILDAQAPYPELREGFSDISLLDTYKEVIHIILHDVFSEVLTQNEIKTASLPFHDIVFNSSQRFQRILKDAGGEGFKPEMRNLPNNQMYISACTVILNAHYGYHLDFKRPFFYDIPDAQGVMRHYRILYNADFMEILPTDKSKKLTQADVNELLDNFDDLELWKEKIPPNSFLSKGFVISNMFDVTAEHSISDIKSGLISNDKRGSQDFIVNLQETFRSFFNIPNIKAGFVSYNSKDDRFERVAGSGIDSYILMDKEAEVCKTALCESSYQKLLAKNDYFAISDVDRFYTRSGGIAPFKNLKNRVLKVPFLHLLPMMVSYWVCSSWSPRK